MIGRRGFLAALAGAVVADPERLLWVPGAKVISVPKPAEKFAMFARVPYCIPGGSFLALNIDGGDLGRGYLSVSWRWEEINPVHASLHSGHNKVVRHSLKDLIAAGSFNFDSQGKIVPIRKRDMPLMVSYLEYNPGHSSSRKLRDFTHAVDPRPPVLISNCDYPHA